MAHVNKQLLAFAREHETHKQPCRIRMRRLLHDATAARNERRALARIDNRHRRALCFCQERDVFGAIEHHLSLTKRNLLRWIICGLDLHDVLSAQLLEIIPAQEVD